MSSRNGSLSHLVSEWISNCDTYMTSWSTFVNVMHHGFCGHCADMNNLYVLGYYIVQENENCRDNRGLFPEYLPKSSARVDRPIRSTRAEDSGGYHGYQIIKLPLTWRFPSYHVPLLSVIRSLRGDNGMRHMELTFIINVIEIKYHS